MNRGQRTAMAAIETDLRLMAEHMVNRADVLRTLRLTAEANEGRDDGEEGSGAVDGGTLFIRARAGDGEPRVIGAEADTPEVAAHYKAMAGVLGCSVPEAAALARRMAHGDAAARQTFEAALARQQAQSEPTAGMMAQAASALAPPVEPPDPEAEAKRAAAEAERVAAFEAHAAKVAAMRAEAAKAPEGDTKG